MKLPINTSFVIQVAAQADIELEEARQRPLHLTAPLPMRLSIAEVEAVLIAPPPTTINSARTCVRSGTSSAPPA